jgi:hypothetical protein
LITLSLSIGEAYPSPLTSSRFQVFCQPWLGSPSTTSAPKPVPPKEKKGTFWTF